MDNFNLDRRSILLAAAGTAASNLPARIGAQTPAPVADTTCGKIRRRSRNGVHVFKGIRFGAPTGGANRFLPPQPVNPWGGVQDALSRGGTAPQVTDHARLVGGGADLPAVNEDCLFLNVLTPEASPATRRPGRALLAAVRRAGATHLATRCAGPGRAQTFREGPGRARPPSALRVLPRMDLF